MSFNSEPWICCQLGAREHYAIPRALRQMNRLELLVTDIWIEPSHPLNLLPKSYLTNLRERYHSELATAPVKALNNCQIAWELRHKYQKIGAWEKITTRNIWWQRQVIKILDCSKISDKNTTFFVYSYAALELLKYAKSRGWKTILGQIDPGIIEQKLVTAEAKKYPQLAAIYSSPSTKYWSDWQQECKLADQIIVNSEWSSQALQKIDVSRHKIKTIPLAYQPQIEVSKFTRSFPLEFSKQRPLRVLFLGQVIIRKGIGAILEAIQLLVNYPIEFWFVGQVEICIPSKMQNNSQVKWFGTVPRSMTNYYYQQADVFLLPTHSDGFGLTQLEAQSWKLPLIISQFCGAVVKDGINGLILPNITGKKIAEALIFCQQNPPELTRFSQNSTSVLSDFSLNKLAQELQKLDT